MERKYTYENGTIYIIGSIEKSMDNIKRGTEEFLQKVIKENPNYGHDYKSRDFREK